jgi:hypothetical protein
MLPCWRGSVSGVGGSGSEGDTGTTGSYGNTSTCQRYEVYRPVPLKTVVRVSSPGGPLRFYYKNGIKTQNE